MWRSYRNFGVQNFIFYYIHLMYIFIVYFYSLRNRWPVYTFQFLFFILRHISFRIIFMYILNLKNKTFFVNSILFYFTYGCIYTHYFISVKNFVVQHHDGKYRNQKKNKYKITSSVVLQNWNYFNFSYQSLLRWFIFNIWSLYLRVKWI